MGAASIVDVAGRVVHRLPVGLPYFDVNRNEVPVQDFLRAAPIRRPVVSVNSSANEPSYHLGAI